MKEIKITDNGETEVQVATLGMIIGSDSKGNPMEQNFTKEAFDKMAQSSPDEEWLVDRDHKSIREGDTESCGWLTKLKSTSEGLFGTIKWTDLGRKLIESRAFRFLSPVFKLDENGTPMELVNVALTNMPSQHGKIRPIVNSYSDMGRLMVVTPDNDNLTDTENSEPIENTEEKLKMEITKEELAAMVKAMCEEFLKSTETSEETSPEASEETSANNEQSTCDEQSANDEPKEETSTEKSTGDESTESDEPKEETSAGDEQKEVIKVEVLNSEAKVDGVAVNDEPWKNMTPMEFVDWCEKNHIR